VTLADIAERVGVTTATVSNAYNRPDKLSTPLREEILAVAKDLGYAGPDPVGRSLSRGKTGAIGWIIPESLSYLVSDPAMLPFLQGMAEELRKARLGFLILPSSSGEAPDASVVRDALVDGFVVTFARDDPFMDAALHRGVPLVIVEQPYIQGIPSVLVEQQEGAERAAKHLLDLGHRSFGIVSLRTGHDDHTGPLSPERLADIPYDTTRLRLTGYRDAFVSAGVDFDSVPIYEPVSTREGGREAALWLLERSPRPTAILAMSDITALGVLDAARSLGISVPDELSIVGFDGIEEGESTSPGLTTVVQPLHEKGVQAIRMLLSPEQFDTQLVTLPATLTVRGSTAPPLDG
jgi:DNA-binding LacI/PurR family transcriptional regulator